MGILETKNLAVGYGGNPLVRDICLNVERGRILALVGPNGAGKSTILRTAAGMLEAVGGTVLLEGENLAGIKSGDRARRMSVMTTSRTETEYISCFDAVAAGRYQFTGISGRLSAADRAAVEAALDSVGALDLRDADFSRISDGQKQRVLLARALAQEPSVLVLDEPTSFLDIGYKLEFIDRLKVLVREKNIGVLMSMHELELVRSCADLVACVSAEGNIQRIGPAETVLEAEYIEELFCIPAGRLEETYGGWKGISKTGNAIGKTGTGNSEVSKNGNAAGKTGTGNTAGISKTGKRPAFIMVQGTMSGAGKSLIAAGLCRIFRQDGYRVVPFKSQNMALNSYITEEGLEMGRAQVMQAEAAGVAPSVLMNPILLKPTDDKGSQVIVNGRVLGNMQARDYFSYKKQLIPDIMHAIDKLSETADIIVIEGAGSPAEINLKENDIVNMGMAELVDAPVILVGDIDRGGVFAQLLGTLELLEDHERDRVKGLIVNKFRGDKTILDPGIEMLEARSGKPAAGVIPYMQLMLEDEDSLTDKFYKRNQGSIILGVVRLPHISNFTDFDVFQQIPEISVRYLTRPEEIALADMLIIPGSKNTIGDMEWLRESGMDSAIVEYAGAGGIAFGICGGYQMLGRVIKDPEGVEAGGTVEGLGLLPVETVLRREKQRCQTRGSFCGAGGGLEALCGLEFEGYEIHMGQTLAAEAVSGDEGKSGLMEFTSGSTGLCMGNVYGTYIHGIFDGGRTASALAEILAARKGISVDTAEVTDYRTRKDREYDRLAEVMREHMDMGLIYRMMGIKND